MPTNKKPRKAHRPKRVTRNTPLLSEVMRIFGPLHQLFADLKTGVVDCVRGEPVMRDWGGEVIQVAPAMRGWCDCWDRISAANNVVLDLMPLRKLAGRLNIGMPVTPYDVQQAEACVQATQNLFRVLPVEELRRHAVTEEISIAMERVTA